MRVKIKIDPFGIFIDFQSENEVNKTSVYFAYPLYYQYRDTPHPHLLTFRGEGEEDSFS